MSNVDNIIKSGEYFGIGLDTGRIGVSRINALKDRLQLTQTKLVSQNYSDITKEDIVGDVLYATITSYFAQLDMTDEVSAAITGIIRFRAPSIGLYSLSLNVHYLLGTPLSAGSKGMRMDVDRIMQSVFSTSGDMDIVKRYMLSSGSISSALEHMVPEQLYSLPGNPAIGISAVKALQIASDQGIPLYTINQSNVNTIIVQLEIDQNAKNDIVNAVNAGMNVTVSKTNIESNGWSGCGYIIENPTTGSGAYMISGNASGADVAFMFGSAGILLLLGGLIGVAVGALFLSIILIAIGLLLVYMEMETMFGGDRTNAFIGCTSEMLIGHYIIEKLAHLIPIAVVRDYIQRFMTVFGIHEFSGCWADLNRPD